MATSTEPAVRSVAPHNRLIGPMPKIGIRPAIDGRRKGVRESLERQTLEMAAGRGAPARSRGCATRTACRSSAWSRRPASAAWPRRRRRRRSSSARASASSLTVTPVLVLRRRDDGHEPAHAEGGVGLQRHRAAGRRLPRRGARRPQPEGPAGLRHLRARRAGPRRRHDSRRTSRRSCCASRGPGSPSPRCAASRTCRWAAPRWASPARSSTTTSSRTTSACASRRST